MIPFSPPRIDQLIIDEVVDTLRSGWITTGPKTKLLESRLTDFCNSKATLCLNSATAGLELILRWYGVGEGDEVILPAYTYAATANVVMHCGARPVFADSSGDFNLDVAAVKPLITDRTKVIMPVDFGGWPCDYDALNALVAEQEIRQLFRPATPEQINLGRILILSDAAHSLGAIYKNRRTGSLTDISVFSFHAVKNLTTAEGGAIALNLPMPFDNVEIYKKLCIKSLHGQNKDALAKMQKGNWKYDILEPGYKMNMTDIQASIGLVELNRYADDTLLKRKLICDYYNSVFSEFDWAKLPLQETGQDALKCITSYHLYPLRIKGISEETRDRIIQDIFNEDVSVNVHFIPVPAMSFYKNLGYSMKNYPRAQALYNCEISLPVFYEMTEEQYNKVARTVVEVVNRILNTKTI